MGKTWGDFIRDEGFEGMKISRTRGRPPKNPRDPIIENAEPVEPKRFPKPSKFTFTGKRKSPELQEQRNFKREKYKPSVCKPNSTNPSPRRFTHHKGFNFDVEFVPSSPKIKIMEQNKTK